MRRGVATIVTPDVIFLALVDPDQNLIRPQIADAGFHGFGMAGQAACCPTDRLCDHQTLLPRLLLFYLWLKLSMTRTLVALMQINVDFRETWRRWHWRGYSMGIASHHRIRAEKTISASARGRLGSQLTSASAGRNDARHRRASS
jgi:hypothetical protein